MADCCAYSAFQAIQDLDNRDRAFKAAYEREFSRLIVRPFEIEGGRCIRGFDYDPSAVPF
jgi:hypothetical protein